MTFATTDLCDAHEKDIHAGVIHVLPPVFKQYGGQTTFSGQAVTVKLFEDNTVIKNILENENGTGKVLVVDAGASVRCAVLGGNIGAAAVKNNWAGVIVNGAVRDIGEISVLPLGILALALHPVRAIRRNEGVRDITVHIQGATVQPNDWVYVDADGALISPQCLN
ncbi:ribonuclease E activity regulator RraA [Hydromonas duriensis]|uniref:4-hydroxy-4-methyl-2-oxoglutarate aldolase n=1 Tax=Hydromonas duriensis TaxID=1527608 RepID=A0A4R6Y6X8_9BURK|nr:ribonuclease E activity regulator RraA [Hydromonas duriensis]TDR29098.1 regulator of ribonuclease activity A [Hydromonas duriensis]